jgi:hypothetical protein
MPANSRWDLIWGLKCKMWYGNKNYSLIYFNVYFDRYDMEIKIVVLYIMMFTFLYMIQNENCSFICSKMGRVARSV